MKLAIIGCGNLGQSIVNGLLESGQSAASDIYATRRHLEEIDFLGNQGVVTTSDNNEAVNSADIILLAVKPYNMTPVLREITDSIDPSRHILVSVATGYSISQMRSVVGNEVTVIRAMPNTATDVRESVTCLAFQDVSDTAVKKVRSVFDAIGSTIIIDENLMEASTVLGACGIAYVLRFIRAMIQGGIQIGFDARTATDIVNQTVKGAAQLLIERDQHPEHEIDKVTTPKGCTIVGLNEMEHNGFSSSLIKGIVASYHMIEK